MSKNRKLYENLATHGDGVTRIILEAKGAFAYVQLKYCMGYWNSGAWHRNKTVGALLVPTALMEWNDA